MLNNWDKIKEIFQRAIELPSEKRNRFLDKECGDDLQLRKEVESLIESHNNTGSFLETPHLRTLGLISKENSTYSLLGKRVGNYKIEQKIGEGGMSVIFSALRVDDQFKKRVAIKFIKKGMDTDEIIRRFRIEQQALASMEHPNIARIIDGGTTESGLPYFVMELIEGVPIDEYCDIHKLNIIRRLDLFQKVCSAIQYAHRNLIVHRDIKMSNIFVTEDGTPKLLDFGIAKILQPSNEQTRFTQTGMKLMTLEYASPEQFKGKQITTATDIYSLGVVLYELLTGHYPFKFKNFLPAEIEDVICNSNPKKPSAIISEFEKSPADDGTENIISADLISKNRKESFVRIKKRLTGELDNIILKAMRKEPERRYSSVEQFTDDIGRYLGGLPVLAHTDSIFYRTKKFYERNRLAVIAAVIIIIIFIAGTIGIIYNANIAEKQRDKAQLEAAKAEKINMFLQELFSSPDPSKEGKDIKVVDVLESAVKRIDSELSAQPEIQASLRTTIGITYQNLGLYNEAVVQLNKAMETYKFIFGEMNVKTAGSIKNLALAFHYKGDYKKADSLYEKAVEIYKKIGIKNKVFADAINDHGTLEMELGYYDKSIKQYEEALSIYKEIKDTSDMIAAISNMALSFDYKGSLDTAEALYKKALRLITASPDDNELQAAHVYNNLAFIYYAKNNLHKAIEIFKKSYEIRERILGNKHPEFAMAAYNLGCMIYKNQNYNDAENMINEAKDIWEETLPRDHHYLGKVYYWLGKIYNQKSQPKQAQNYLLISIKIRSNNPVDNNFILAITKCELGRSLVLQKKYNEAESILLENFEIMKNERSKNDENVKSVAELLAELYLKWNKPREAEKYSSKPD